MAHSKEKIHIDIGTNPQEAQIFNLLNKDFKTILNMLSELIKYEKLVKNQQNGIRAKLKY